MFFTELKLRNEMAHFAMVLVDMLLICSGLHAGQGANILALLNVASPSHNIFNTALTTALAERGHQVGLLCCIWRKHKGVSAWHIVHSKLVIVNTDTERNTYHSILI